MDSNIIPMAPSIESPGLYPRLLGAEWKTVPPAIRHMHSQGVTIERRGKFRISRASSFAGRVLARLLRLPRVSEREAVRLVVTPIGVREDWRRYFGGKLFRTMQHGDARGRMVERFLCLELTVRVEARGDSLLYHQERAALAAGPLRLPLPRWLAPQVTGSETAVADGVVVSVKVTLPCLGLLIAYDGNLEM